MTRYCEQCGSIIAEGESFCSKCGKPVGEGTTIGELPEVQSTPEKGHGTIGLLVPTKELIIILLLIAALILIPKAIYEVNNRTYKSIVEERDECIIKQQDLPLTLMDYQKDYEIYEGIISDYDKMIKDYRTKALAYGVFGLLSAGLAVTLIVQVWKKKHRAVETGANEECVRAMQTDHCQHCGNPVQEGMAFCSYCGAKIGDARVMKKRKIGKYFVIIVAAVLLLAACTTFFVRYINNKNIFKDAYEKAGGDEVCKKWVTVMRDGSGIKIDTNPRNIEEFYDDDALKAVRRINNALGMPDSVIEKMLSTRALDGRQSQTYNGITVSWTYHPDAGLEIVYERT